MDYEIHDHLMVPERSQLRSARAKTAVLADDRLWTSRDVAAFLQISERTLQTMLRTAESESGSLPHVRLGKLVRFVAEDVKAWAAQGCPPLAQFRAWKQYAERRKSAGKNPNMVDLIKRAG